MVELDSLEEFEGFVPDVSGGGQPELVYRRPNGVVPWDTWVTVAFGEALGPGASTVDSLVGDRYVASEQSFETACTMADADGSGTPAVLVGQTGLAPSFAHLLPLEGEGIVHDVTDRVPDYPEPASGSGYGAHVGCGDIDGDGIGDVAIAAPFMGPDATGRVFVYLR